MENKIVKEVTLEQEAIIYDSLKRKTYDATVAYKKLPTPMTEQEIDELKEKLAEIRKLEALRDYFLPKEEVLNTLKED